MIQTTQLSQDTALLTLTDNEGDEVLHLGDSQYTEVYYSDGEEIIDESMI